jgi:hypothetical protein
MRRSTVPYSVPSKLEAGLARVRAYWEGLKRGDAGIPFWDDVNLAALPDLSHRVMLIEVFDKPLRFRFGIVGEELKERYGADVVGRFSDEIEIHHPFQYLNSQALATVESRAPTYYRHEAYRHEATKRGSSRAADPFQYLNSQGLATIESRAPTYYRHEVAEHGSSRATEGYSRLILPMWGDGRIGMLLGAVAWG